MRARAFWRYLFRTNNGDVKEMVFEMYNFSGGGRGGERETWWWDRREREREEEEEEEAAWSKTMVRGEDPSRQRLDFRAHFSGGFRGFDFASWRIVNC